MSSIQDFHDRVIALQPVDLLHYVEDIPEFKLMADCQQSPPHHLEGDVLVHSNMAAGIVLQLMEAEHVEDLEDQIVLYLATILHDIGKPTTSMFNEKKNKITAYGHDDAGVPLANEFLKKYFPEFLYRGRERILRLIENHMHPRRWIQEGTTVNKMKMLSLATNTKLLYLLSQADTLGRKAADMKSGMMSLELFKQECQDMGIWKKQYRVPLATHLDNASYSLARWNILMEDAPESQDTYDEAREMMGKPIPPFQLMLMVGAPGSGKTTIREQLQKQYPTLKVLSMDDRRKEICGDVHDQSKNGQIFGWQERELRKAMKERQTVLVDATNPTRKLRKTLWRIARENGALCSAIYFDLKLETLLARNAAREKRVPDDVVKRFYNAQQFIHPVEADMIRIVTEADKI
jgi:putative nucleotidyltransferase with HDIG domain